ncbi:MAG TPA: sigma-70 family RNA polymerase sigma factor [Verrucomicrobiae bacterium]
MTDLSDSDLLAQFARTGSEPAFAALVERHLSLVHSIARRHTADPEQARDIAQAVFIILARKAGTLGHKVVLSGRLYHTTRLTALNWQRSEIRRLRREQEAFMQSELTSDTPEELWRELSPQLEAAMATLGAKERDALVLRYFQNQTMSRVAAEAGCTENTAQKRVGRGLETLRKFFGKRGLRLSAAAIAASVAANAVHAAPVGLAGEISAVAVLKGSTATTAIIALVNTTMKTMFWNNMKLTFAVVIAAILATGAVSVLAQRADKPMARIPYKMLEDAWLFQESINQTNLSFKRYPFGRSKPRQRKPVCAAWR